MSIPLESANAGSSHILIAEGSLLVRCLWKVGLPLQLKKGNLFSSRDDMGCTELSSCCCGEIGIPLELDGYIRESLVLPKKAIHLSCMLWNAGWLSCQCIGIRHHIELILCTPNYFA